MRTRIKVVNAGDLRHNLTGLAAGNEYIDLVCASYCRYAMLIILSNFLKWSKAAILRLPLKCIVEALVIDDFHNGHTVDISHAGFDSHTALRDLGHLDLTGKLSGLLQGIHDGAGHVHDQSAICLVSSQLALCQDVLQHTEHLGFGIGCCCSRAVIALLLLSRLGNLGEEQRIRLRHHLGLLEVAGNVLDGSGCVGLIHIGLIHQERNIAVVGQGKRYIRLRKAALIPATISVMILISRGGKSGKMESLSIQPFYVSSYERGS